MEGGGVGVAQVLGEAVVAGAVEHAVEPAVETLQAGGVGHRELDIDALLPGAMAGLPDGGGSGVDGGDLVALTGEVDGVVAQATTHVEHGSVETPVTLGLDDDRLGATDVPGNGGDINALDELPCLVQGVEVHVVEVDVFGDGTHGLLLLGAASDR
jgi:hypothetical protein